MLDVDEDDYDCPLCMEELDISDRNFKPCPCGYQICCFCWKHIRENLNGCCPACRREYSDKQVEFQPVSPDEVLRYNRERKEKDRKHKDMEAANRKHLANMRVVQKNLVYVIGLNPKTITEEDIRSQGYFGQFGKIAKVVINRRPATPASSANSGGATHTQPSIAVYVTYQRKEDAAKAIHAVDGKPIGERTIRASYGTTKYCTYYLRNLNCPNPSCLYLHEPGEEADTISKEELATGKHRMRDQISTDYVEDKDGLSGPHSNQPHSSSSLPSALSDVDFPTVSAAANRQRKQAVVHASKTLNRNSTAIHTDTERSALPTTASWAKHGGTHLSPVLRSGETPSGSASDLFGPPLSTTSTTSQKQQVLPTLTSRQAEKRHQSSEHTTDVSTGLQSECSDTTTTDTSHSSRPVTPSESLLTNRLPHEGLAEFVLGDASRELCPLFSALDLDNSETKSNVHEKLRHNQFANLANEVDDAQDFGMSALDFLLQNSRDPVYSGTFNPFVHYTSSSIRESATRKHSRFGFAQK